MIKGVKIPFLDIPTQDKEPRPFNLAKEEIDFVNRELVILQDKCILEIAEPTLGQVISNIFLRPKKDGTYRMILDLTWVNTHVEYSHFKMHSLKTALDLMRKDCWMAFIDLKDAYYSIPVDIEHRKFLRFRWGNVLYQFRVLPNGFACAPRFFTKILNPVSASLRDSLERAH